MMESFGYTLNTLVVSDEKCLLFQIPCIESVQTKYPGVSPCFVGWSDGGVGILPYVIPYIYYIYRGKHHLKESVAWLLKAFAACFVSLPFRVARLLKASVARKT